MSERIKVLFLINSLGGGGAERVLVNLANNMDKTKFDITVQTMFSAGVNKEYLHKDIHFIETNAPYFKGISRLIKLLPPSILYKYFVKDQYDVLIAYMHGAPTKVIWGCKDEKVGRIAWLHTDMRQSSLPKFLSHDQAVRCFQTYSKIVGVSQSVSQSFVKIYGMGDRVVTRYNTNDVSRIIALAQEPIPAEDDWKDVSVRLITVGRLTPEKGYARLTNCCCRLKADGFRFELLVMGRGPEEGNLTEQIAQMGLQDTVRLIGFRNNPYPMVSQADLFVCSSHQEGLSTAISEAIILGIPVISTDVSGAKEVLGENNEYGLVVENDDNALYEGMKKLLSDPALLVHYREKAAERSNFFETRRTVRAVEELIEEVVGL